MIPIMRNSCLGTVFLLPIFLFGAPQSTFVDRPGLELPYEPWFTGTLLAPTPVNMAPGHPAIEPSITIFNSYGRYDSDWSFKKTENIWTINPLIDFQFGFTENTGLEIYTAFVTNFRDGKSSTRLSDTIVLLGYQASNDVKDTWIPDCRLFLQTIFPSGSYDRLDPTRVTIDFSGQGAYFFGPSISYQKLFYFQKNFFSLHLSVGYFFPTRTRVRDISVYGGTIGTAGSIRPGQSFIGFFSGEYSINQRWVISYDTVFLYQRKTSRFKGDPGLNPDGSLATVGLPSSNQISIAPTIEYNFSPTDGLFFGVWFTVAGRNSSAFASGFVAYVYVF